MQTLFGSMMLSEWTDCSTLHWEQRRKSQTEWSTKRPHLQGSSKCCSPSFQFTKSHLWLAVRTWDALQYHLELLESRQVHLCRISIWLLQRMFCRFGRQRVSLRSDSKLLSKDVSESEMEWTKSSRAGKISETLRIRPFRTPDFESRKMPLTTNIVLEACRQSSIPDLRKEAARWWMFANQLDPCKIFPILGRNLDTCINTQSQHCNTFWRDLLNGSHHQPCKHASEFPFSQIWLH